MKNIFDKILVFLAFLVLLCRPTSSESLYKISRNNGKITISFNENWTFNDILIPVCSSKIWGDNKVHNVAIIEFNNEKHILSAKQGDKYLLFLEDTKPINSFILTSINNSSEQIEEASLIFRATQAKTKEIEDELLVASNNELERIRKNKCFSCHTLIPVALSLKTAKDKGFNIDSKKVEELFDSISELQKENGSFYFETEPTYGERITTLSCAYILSLLSDFSNDKFVNIGEKIYLYLGKIEKNDEIIEPDFVFKPFFNDETTPILFESIFLKTFYLNTKAVKEEANIRANSLLKIAVAKKEYTFIDKLILLSGVPYSYQFVSNKREELIEELKRGFELPKGKISTITRLLSLYVSKKIAPDMNLPSKISQNNYDNNLLLWKSLEKVLYNTPKYLNGPYDEK